MYLEGYRLQIKAAKKSLEPGETRLVEGVVRWWGGGGGGAQPMCMSAGSKTSAFVNPI